MKTYRFPPRAVNPEALDAELRTAMPDSYASLLVSDSELRVFLNQDLPQSEVQAVLDAHDPASLTPEQQAEQARQEALAEARRNNASNLDGSQYDAEAPLMRQLAQKIIWLEQEIRDLRDL